MIELLFTISKVKIPKQKPHNR